MKTIWKWLMAEKKVNNLYLLVVVIIMANVFWHSISDVTLPVPAHTTRADYTLAMQLNEKSEQAHLLNNHLLIQELLILKATNTKLTEQLKIFNNITLDDFVEDTGNDN